MTIDAPADYVRQLDSTAREAARWLAALPASVITWKPSPSAWCIKEIIGHLVDSAANNHQRFVRAAEQDDLVFSGYAQEHWVRTQAYESAPWDDLVTLWAMYNRHLARVMTTVPANIRERRHERHNLHEIGWRPFSAKEPAALDDLMHDYVLHLEHHLTQVRDRIRGAELASRTA